MNKIAEAEEEAVTRIVNRCPDCTILSATYEADTGRDFHNVIVQVRLASGAAGSVNETVRVG